MKNFNGSSASVNSSPSSEAESRHGTTPGTALTRPSPIGPRADSESTSNETVKKPPQFSLQTVPGHAGSDGKASTIHFSGMLDPFTTSPGALTSTNTGGLKLSPTATTFMPNSPFEIGSTHRVPYGGQAESLHAYLLKNPHLKTGVGYLNATSVPDIDVSPSQLMLTTNSAPAAVGTDLSSSGPCNDSVSTDPKLTWEEPKFSTSGVITRYLRLSNVPKTVGIEELDATFGNPRFTSPKIVVVSKLATEGLIYVQFSDIRDAQCALPSMSNCQPNWIIEYISGRDYAATVDPIVLPDTSDFEGQIIAAAHCEGPRHAFEISAVVLLVKDLLQSFGELMACDVPITTFPTVAVRAEYYDSADAGKALGLDGIKVAGISLSVTPFAPDLGTKTPSRAASHGPVIVGQDEDDLDNLVGGFPPRSHPLDVSKAGSYASASLSEQVPVTPIPNRNVNSVTTPMSSRTFTVPGTIKSGPYVYHSPGMTPYAPQWNGFSPGAVGQERIEPYYPRSRNAAWGYQRRGSPKHSPRPNSDYASGNHNVVDIERIRQGLDVRTTIMLRNIPNKIDQAMLKRIVDETSHGKYDFTYLRIDFANNCNVGYAFINFEDPWFIIDFVKARAGRRWNRFNSDKVAEVSYATIQGKDCLVQKFRNSSVMLEHPSFRPKIFHTGTGPLASKEDIFPGPDNPSKMRRSVENAEHVGLFAPRAGQHFRDEQRRRRSQYDRGTRLAELEDSCDHGYNRRASYPDPRVNGTFEAYQSLIGTPRSGY